jgi:hypothetical protein
MTFHSFKVTEVALMMDWEDHTNDDGASEHWHISSAVSNLRKTDPSSSCPSIRGLQMALAEGWLIQLARDLCSFAHDRYRQAVQIEAASLPEGVTAKMRFRVRNFHLFSFRCATEPSCLEDYFGVAA